MVLQSFFLFIFWERELCPALGGTATTAPSGSNPYMSRADAGPNKHGLVGRLVPHRCAVAAAAVVVVAAAADIGIDSSGFVATASQRKDPCGEAGVTGVLKLLPLKLLLRAVSDKPASACETAAAEAAVEGCASID
jgi:hypothetical protein